MCVTDKSFRRLFTTTSATEASGNIQSTVRSRAARRLLFFDRLLPSSPSYFEKKSWLLHPYTLFTHALANWMERREKNVTVSKNILMAHARLHTRCHAHRSSSQASAQRISGEYIELIVFNVYASTWSIRPAQRNLATIPQPLLFLPPLPLDQLLGSFSHVPSRILGNERYTYTLLLSKDDCSPLTLHAVFRFFLFFLLPSVVVTVLPLERHSSLSYLVIFLCLSFLFVGSSFSSDFFSIFSFFFFSLVVAFPLLCCVHVVALGTRKHAR